MVPIKRNPHTINKPLPISQVNYSNRNLAQLKYRDANSSFLSVRQSVGVRSKADRRRVMSESAARKWPTSSVDGNGGVVVDDDDAM